jgi:NAD(P)-dependent dehydrogenase (short-subunit alcohol dehydrogenase family)
MNSDRRIIIVTGSNGRIGDAVMRRFAGRFDQVVGFDREAPGPPPPGCVAVPVEITSDESVREGLIASTRTGLARALRQATKGRAHWRRQWPDHLAAARRVGIR